jgi:selenide,water dikinase
VNKLPAAIIARILAGGQSVCTQAGVVIAGGHSIDSPEPIYGLVALGLVHPANVKRNDRAHNGDVLILGKGLGVGILSAALKKGVLPDEAYAQMIDCTTRLNVTGADLATMEEVHALTDVTGFGLLGHLLEICRGSGVGARIRFDDIPILSAARHYAQAGHVTGASSRNWSSFGKDIDLPSDFAPWQANLLTDPQTAGGLLVACTASSAERILQLFRRDGFDDARIIGEVLPGAAKISVV